MSKLQLRILILCIIIFVLLIAFSVFIVWYFIKLITKSIKNGSEDENLKKEYQKQEVRKSKVKKIVNIVSYTTICIVFVVLCLLCLLPKITCDGNKITTSSAVVVKSTSMAEKNSKNTYLVKNNLNNQFDMFDIVFINKLPGEFKLKLYDIVVYELDGNWVIHRIVKIEEPNSTHPNQRYFTLQGDAVGAPDYKTVTYDQMIAIYSNSKIPFVGSFILFVQSIPGILCILAVAIGLTITPLLGNKLNKIALNRLVEIGYLPGTPEELNKKINTKELNNLKDKKE